MQLISNNVALLKLENKNKTDITTTPSGNKISNYFSARNEDNTIRKMTPENTTASKIASTTTNNDDKDNSD